MNLFDGLVLRQSSTRRGSERVPRPQVARDTLAFPSGATQASTCFGVLEASAREGGTRQVGIPQVGAGQTGLRQVCPHEARIPEISKSEVGPLKMSL